MALATLLTRGYGNATFSGTIPLVLTRGYFVASAGVASAAFTSPDYTLRGADAARHNVNGPRAIAHKLTKGYGRINLEGGK